MKKFELDLTAYEVEIPGENNGIQYPIRDNLSSMLRAAGVFKSGEDTAEAVSLGKSIMAAQLNDIILDEREMEILKSCLNRHISATAEGKAMFGGPVHEECILRVFGAKEITNAPQ